MSTRAVVNFVDTYSPQPVAKVYRHCDGYPDGLGEDLKRFFAHVENTLVDTRFEDPSYLAAKWLVWDSMQTYNYDRENPLDFTTIGIVMETPADAQFEYDVVCTGANIPHLVCIEIGESESVLME